MKGLPWRVRIVEPDVNSGKADDSLAWVRLFDRQCLCQTIPTPLLRLLNYLTRRP
jgi:hypothetical protein